VVQDIVQFRAASRGVEGWSLQANLTRSRQELAPEGPLLLVLSGLGLILALSRPAARPLALWLVGSLGLILFTPPCIQNISLSWSRHSLALGASPSG